MPRAICEDCGSLVEAELTHNGICAVGHYVHCGWGHDLSPDDLISDDVVEIIADLEAKLAKAEWLLTDAAVQLEDGKIKTRRNRAGLIWQFLEETKGT